MYIEQYFKDILPGKETGSISAKILRNDGNFKYIFTSLWENFSEISKKYGKKFMKFWEQLFEEMLGKV